MQQFSWLGMCTMYIVRTDTPLLTLGAWWHHVLPECDPTVTTSWSSYFPLCKLPTPVSFLKYLKKYITALLRSESKLNSTHVCESETVLKVILCDDISVLFFHKMM